jgi:spore maturation protein B
MVAVGVLRASGFLDMLTDLFGKCLSFWDFPTELLPLVITKMFSSSAATGLLLDIYKEYGTDSYPGLAASLLLSSTETIFYTMSVYFMSVSIKKTRYTLAGALFSSIVGIAASIWIARYI